MVDVQTWVGRTIRVPRRTKGLSQFQLAERSRVSADFIGKIERGTTSPPHGASRLSPMRCISCSALSLKETLGSAKVRKP